MKVIKKSGKPFKSGNKMNTVKGQTINYDDPKRRLAYVFLEDDSIVNLIFQMLFCMYHKKEKL